MSVYKVTGRVPYDGYPPGAMFEAYLDERVEYRAVRRGNITLIERSTPAVRPGSFTPPRRHG